ARICRRTPGTCQVAQGRLCRVGYIWFGIHYWKFVCLGAILVLIWCIIMNYKVKNGKKILIFNAFIAIKKYKFLIEQMVARDFKTKYKRSVLGIFWSFLNPLLTMLVQYFVFSNIFKNDIPYYHVYLLIGVVMFNFFSEACGMTLTSILGNANLMTKVYVPKYIYPLVRVLSSAVNLLISLIPLLLITLFSGIVLTKAIFLSIFAILCLMIFSLGLGLILSTSMVFFRDTQFLWGVFSMIWMYLTPIFYPENILPKNFVGILKINPLYYYVNFVRSCIIDEISPEPRIYFICAINAIIMLAIGAFAFKKNQDKFIFYL
ncbi:ABC transporter permease, partial [uncultured Clostridium sp.]|uniref:ABC transporter permease n=1 Tax=uncultured Clostridium sp. TaxID=59620 RepID=UPI0025D4F13D